MSTPFGEKITSLTADADYDNSIIEAIRSDKEYEAISRKSMRSLGTSPMR